MKAEERHRLKTNELAETLAELPQYVRTHRSKIITVAIAVVVVLVAGVLWRRAKASKIESETRELQVLLMQAERMQYQAAWQASPQASDEEIATIYDPAALTTSLASLAADPAGKSLGAAALVYQAELARSKLLFSDLEISQADRDAICQRADALYNMVLRDYAQMTWAVGMAKLGLGLVAEEQGQFDKAAQVYQEILDQAEGAFAATIYPAQAARRLAGLDDLAEPIEFAAERPVADEPVVSAPSEAASPDSVQSLLQGIDPVLQPDIAPQPDAGQPKAADEQQ